ncbi:hypothetical protein TCSYLVIO_006754 [Trypanosoma cruzi]|nr:hypothetical protein TCSYLVIO_006754 [Trypanosoma cruzi]
MASSDDDSRCVLGTHFLVFLWELLQQQQRGLRQRQLVSWRGTRRGTSRRGRIRWTRLRWQMKAFFYGLLLVFFRSAACRCLTGCLHAAPFEALRCFIQCDATIIMAASSFTDSECDNTNDGKTSDEVCGDDLHRGADYLRVSVHESKEGLNSVPTIPGLTEPLAFALSPAVISAPCVEADPFTVEFTQQLSSVCAAGPALALSHVFQRCLADDLMSVLSRPPPPVFSWCPIRNTLRCGGYLFAWPLTHVTMLNGCVFCLAGMRETSLCADASAKLFVDGWRRK